MIIAIDGPSGSGKSSIAKKISKILNIAHLDTGAMYRAFALKVYRDKLNIDEALKIFNIHFENDKVYMDNEDVSSVIRENEISKLASSISKLREVREYMVNLQREISKSKDIVLDGRDIGTVVFPNAEVKVFLTASPEVRAKRRSLEDSKVPYEKILEDIIKRDEQDANREIAPSVKASDAILLDTTNLSIDEVVEEILKLVRKNEK